METHTWQFRCMSEEYWDPDAGTPVTSLPVATLTLNDDATLLEAMSRAAAEAVPSLTDETKDAYGRGGGAVAFYRLEADDDVNVLYSLAPEYSCLWGVTGNGHVVRADLDSKNITVGDIHRAAAVGLIEGDITRPIILPGGRGGFDALLQFDWWTFLEHADLLIGLASGPVWAGLKTLRRRRIKKIAAQWARHNLECPSQLRMFINAKTEWQSRDVANLLDISSEDAITLLQGVGYMKDPNSSIYRQDDSEMSKQLLDKWMAAEQVAEERWVAEQPG